MFLHAKTAKSAEIYYLSVFHACAGGVVNFVTTRVRREFTHPSPLGADLCFVGSEVKINLDLFCTSLA